MTLISFSFLGRQKINQKNKENHSHTKCVLKTSYDEKHFDMASHFHLYFLSSAMRGGIRSKQLYEHVNTGL